MKQAVRVSSAALPPPTTPLFLYGSPSFKGPLAVKYLLVVNAFREFFLSIFRTGTDNYRKFLVPSEAGQYEGIKFDKEGFMASQPRAVRKVPTYLAFTLPPSS